MTRSFTAAVLVALILEVLVVGYGAVAAGEQAHAVCSQDHGVVQGHECVRNGRDLFRVPL
ncbi:MAG TPA: hypothetical protein VF049_11780 [Nocardioidaceae bacterium]|jgi:hypothetical protein